LGRVWEKFGKISVPKEDGREKNARAHRKKKIVHDGKRENEKKERKEDC